MHFCLGLPFARMMLGAYAAVTSPCTADDVEGAASLYVGDHVEGVARVAAIGADGDVDGVGAGHEAQAAEDVEADGGLRPVLPGPPKGCERARRQGGCAEASVLVNRRVRDVVTANYKDFIDGNCMLFSEIEHEESKSC